MTGAIHFTFYVKTNNRSMDSPSGIHLPGDPFVVTNFIENVVKFRDACVREIDKHAFNTTGEILETDGTCPLLPTLHLIIKRTQPMGFNGNLEISQVGYDVAAVDANRQLRERGMIPFDTLEKIVPTESTERHFYEEKSRQLTVKPKLRQATLSASFRLQPDDNNLSIMSNSIEVVEEVGTSSAVTTFKKKRKNKDSNEEEVSDAKQPKLDDVSHP
jgi:hypothetical protein